MSCSTANTSAFSLPAAAVDSCWSDGPMASLHHPRHPAGAMGMVRDCWPSLQGAAALGAFIPCTSLSPSACMLGFLFQPPGHHQPPNSSCFITTGSPPALQHPSCCVPAGVVVLRRSVAAAPSIPSPAGQPRCPHRGPPGERAASGYQRGAAHHLTPSS